MSDSIMRSTPRSGEETSSNLLSFSSRSNLEILGLLLTAEKALGLKVSAFAPEEEKRNFKLAKLNYFHWVSRTKGILAKLI